MDDLESYEKHPLIESYEVGRTCDTKFKYFLSSHSQHEIKDEGIKNF